MKRKFMLPVIISSLVVSTTAFAAMKHHKHGDKMDFIAHKLELTGAQKVETRQLFETYVGDPNNIRAQKRLVIEKIQSIDIDAPNYYVQLESIGEEVAEQVAEKVKGGILFKGHFMKLLTPDQRAKFDTMMDRHWRQ